LVLGDALELDETTSKTLEPLGDFSFHPPPSQFHVLLTSADETVDM